MKPITFDTLSDMHRIDLYHDNKRSCTAFVSKITPDNFINSLYYFVAAILPFIIICIPAIVFVVNHENPLLNFTFWFSQFLFTFIAALIFTVLYPIIHDFILLCKTIYIGIDGYLVEVFTFDDEIGKKEKINIFIRKDGFYQDKYNSVITEIFKKAEIDTDGDEILSFIMEE